MKINNVEIMCLKISDPKTNKAGEIYFTIDFAVIEDGSTFSLMIKDVNKIKEFQPFNKAVIDLELTNTRFGLQLKII